MKSHLCAGCGDRWPTRLFIAYRIVDERTRSGADLPFNALYADRTWRDFRPDWSKGLADIEARRFRFVGDADNVFAKTSAHSPAGSALRLGMAVTLKSPRKP